MDDLERDYLRQQIQTLMRSNRWWKALAVGLVASLGLFLILGMGSFFAFRLSVVRQQRVIEAQAAMERARDAEMRARLLKEQAAKLEAEKRNAKAEPPQSK